MGLRQQKYVCPKDIAYSALWATCDFSVKGTNKGIHALVLALKIRSGALAPVS